MRYFTIISLALLATACTKAPEKTDVDEDGYMADVDCDDFDASIHPDVDEVCDGIDNNCDGVVDEDTATDASTWYADTDADGYGDPDVTLAACLAPSGYVSDRDDCDDGNAYIHPGAREDDCADPVDYNCDGSVGYADDDGDGWAACEDCDDMVGSIYPGATETCNDTDDDCDGDIDENAVDGATWWLDADADGYGSMTVSLEACDQPQGYVADSSDCDDLHAASFPGGTEVCDEHDNDCDGTVDEADATDAVPFYLDADEDGYGDPDSSTDACTAPSGYVDNAEDCNDADDSFHPGATEYCGGEDEDCDGEFDEDAVDLSTWYRDVDSDGYGDADSTAQGCTVPAGYTSDDSDCDDAHSDAYPGATEYCDGYDNDCDGSVDEDDADDADTWYVDSDGDGAGDRDYTTTACDEPSGYVSNHLDCYDDDDEVVDCDEPDRTFTTCGATGYSGPSQTQCNTEYGDTDLENEVMVTDGIQEWEVPLDGIWRITAYGAQGASGDSSYVGGMGARVQGEFELEEGDTLYILVGQEGSGQSSGSNGGGGGGSFVVDDVGDPLIIAGGGSGTRDSVSQDGCGGRDDEYGGDGSSSSMTSSCGVSSGSIGYGGAVSSGSWGSGGGGFLGDGDDDYTSGGGSGYNNGGEGGVASGGCGHSAYGGFGGGGSGQGCYGGGGGGGYTGGEGGRVAGGGGSYNDGEFASATSDYNEEEGWVLVEMVHE